MYTSHTIQKLKRIRETIETSRGQQFRLFAAALPHHASTWDVLVSAPWFDDEMMTGLRELSLLLSKLDWGELISFGSIIALDKRSPVYRDIMEEAATYPHDSTIKNQVFGDIEYDRLNLVQYSPDAEAGARTETASGILTP